MSKHTPGPWTLKSDEYGHRIFEPTGTHYICEIFEDDATAAADARLIAAAPELLTACQSLLAMVRRAEREGHKVSNQEGDEYMAAEKVIAKATGGGDA